MDLSALQSLPTSDKLQWLHSDEGIEQLKEWLSTSCSLHRIASTINISKGILYKVCDGNPELTAITGRTLVVAGDNPVKTDYTAPPAYRLIAGLDYSYRHGQIIEEYKTAEDLWKSEFVKRYFKSFDRSEVDYFDGYLAKINQSGICRISNLYCIVYCAINNRGIIQVRKPTT